MNDLFLSPSPADLTDLELTEAARTPCKQGVWEEVLKRVGGVLRSVERRAGEDARSGALELLAIELPSAPAFAIAALGLSKWLRGRVDAAGIVRNARRDACSASGMGADRVKATGEIMSWVRAFGTTQAADAQRSREGMQPLAQVAARANTTIASILCTASWTDAASLEELTELAGDTIDAQPIAPTDYDTPATLQHAVRGAVAGLDHEARAVLTVRYGLDDREPQHDVAAIAKQLGTSARAVKSTLQRAQRAVGSELLGISGREWTRRRAAGALIRADIVF